MAQVYRADIDGLRAVAVLAILLFHVGMPLFGGGYVGVDVFYVISGYLITGIIARGLAEERFSIRIFYLRRIRRIFPALFAMLAGVAAIGWVLFLPVDMQAFGRAAMATVAFVANIQAWLQAGYFDTASSTKPLLHTWSLGVEEQFYLFFPLLLAGWVRIGGRPAVLVGGLFVVSAVLSVVGVRVDGDAAFYLLPTRAWELLAGSLVALAAPKPPSSPLIAEGLAGAGLAAILAAIFLYDPFIRFPGEAALLPVLGSAVLIWVGGGERTTVAGRLLTLRPMVLVGLISYSLYLWHWPLVVFTHLVVVRDFTAIEQVGLIAGSLAAAWASWRFVEQPFRHGGDTPTESRRVFAVAAAAAAVTIAFAAACLPTGFPDRFSPRLQALFAQIEAPHHVFDEVRVSPTPSAFPLADAGFLAGRHDRPPRLAVWGDSHVSMVLPVVHDALVSGRLDTVSVFARGGCAPLVGIYVGYDADLDCNAHNTTVLNHLVKSPEKRVVLVSRWGRVLFGDVRPQGSGEGRPAIAAAPGRMMSVEAARVFLRERLAATLDALLSAGKEVVVVGPFAEIPFEGKRATFHAAAADPNLAELTVPIGPYEVRYREVEAVLAEAIGARPVRLLRPRLAQCAEGRCPLYRDGIVHFADDNHVTWPAASTLVPAFAGMIEGS